MTVSAFELTIVWPTRHLVLDTVLLDHENKAILHSFALTKSLILHIVCMWLSLEQPEPPRVISRLTNVIIGFKFFAAKIDLRLQQLLDVWLRRLSLVFILKTLNCNFEFIIRFKSRIIIKLLNLFIIYLRKKLFKNKNLNKKKIIIILKEKFINLLLFYNLYYNLKDN